MKIVPVSSSKDSRSLVSKETEKLHITAIKNNIDGDILKYLKEKRRREDGEWMFIVPATVCLILLFVMAFCCAIGVIK